MFCEYEGGLKRKGGGCRVKGEWSKGYGVIVGRDDAEGSERWVERKRWEGKFEVWRGGRRGRERLLL